MGLIPVEFLGFAKFCFYFKRDMSSEGFRWGTVIISVTSRMYIYLYQDKNQKTKGSLTAPAIVMVVRESTARGQALLMR